MNVNNILYSSSFEKQFRKIEKDIQKKACNAELLFRKNAFHPGLRLHKLKGPLAGLWSISLDKKNRIIFEPMENGDVLFISIGAHSIYEG